MSQPEAISPPYPPEDRGGAGSDAEGIAAARHYAEAEEGLLRRPAGWGRWAVPVIGVAWCCFQLAIAKWWLLDSLIVRCVHLAFAMAVCFLAFPACRKPRLGLGFLSAADRIPWLDIALACAGVLAAAYLAIDYQGYVDRPGLPLRRDMIIAFLLVALLFEATRRVVGPALSVIALLFTLYAFFGQHMPDILAFGGVTARRYVGQIARGTEGIYGVPLYVSARIVFLFVLFGAMLERAGGGRFFIDLALGLVGGSRGGPAKAAVLSSGLTGMVSGSSIANIVTTGPFTIPLMKKVGYPAKKAAAIEVAASTDGQLAPPIMGAAAFIIAEYIGVSYTEVIKAAAIPAFASYAALFYLTHLEAAKLGLRGMPAEDRPNLRLVLRQGWYYLVPLAVLLYHLIVRRHTPELSAFNAVWVMALVLLVQKPLKAWRQGQPTRASWRESVVDLFTAMSSAARNMVTVALATAAAGVIVGVVSMGPGQRITEIIDVASHGNIYLMLLITAVASLVIGMGLPTTATYIVIASLIAQPIVAVGASHDFVVPLMAAHLFCFYFGILADDTPPVGLAAYAASAIAKSDPIPTGIQGFTYDIRTAILPFMFIFNADLILHNINRWDQAILILVTACLGNFAFAAATQGWFLTRNRLYELPLLLGITLIMLRPDLIARLLDRAIRAVAGPESTAGFPQSQRYWCYLLGAILFAGLYLWQRRRAPAEGDQG